MAKIEFVNHRWVVYRSTGERAGTYDNNTEAILRRREVEREEKVRSNHEREKRREQRKRALATKRRKMKERFKRKPKNFDDECIKKERGVFVVLVARKGEPWHPVGEFETREQAQAELEEWRTPRLAAAAAARRAHAKPASTVQQDQLGPG